MEKRILYIEDDFFIGDLYRRELKNAGYDIDLEQNGAAGLEKIQQQHYDLILLDVMLPGLDGVEILKRMKQTPDLKNIPVIMLSNLAQEAIMQEARTLGAARYLIKDQLLPDQLLREINTFFSTETSPPVST